MIFEESIVTASEDSAEANFKVRAILIFKFRTVFISEVSEG